MRKKQFLDTSTEDGATTLAKHLRAFWHRRGHPEVEAWVEAMSIGNDKKKRRVFTVRTNLIGGLPPQVIELPGRIRQW
jgi:hypothetical protein